jgi:hypothetical protein
MDELTLLKTAIFRGVDSAISPYTLHFLRILLLFGLRRMGVAGRMIANASLDLDCLRNDIVVEQLQGRMMRFLWI